MSNRFDFLRLSFAVIVFIAHLMFLTGANTTSWYYISTHQIGHIAIHGFFVISGALVYGSYERSKSLTDYAFKRLRRLYPAYFTIVTVTALVATFAIGSWQSPLKYAAINLTFLNFLYPEIEGLFENNRAAAVNGALWTLKIEVMFYLAAPIMAWIITRGKSLAAKFLIIAIFYFIGIAWEAYFSGRFMDEPAFIGGYGDQMARQFPGQLQYFSVGIALWILWDRVKTPPLWLLPLGLLCVLPSLWYDAGMLIRAIGVGCIIAWLAFAGTPRFNSAKYGDLSYGIYGIHFPVIQMLVAMGVFAYSAIAGYALAIIVVFVLTLLMWRFVERPFLHPNSHYRKSDRIKSS